ncbi:MAG: chemotaxis protein CheX, partial [Syntrophomonadaceae bacterium]|nr:chemotaxis protein CheX [Syntrophomonadaceae bacterium]
NLGRTGLAKRRALQTADEVNVIIGLVGDLRGTLVLAMPERTATSVASAMMGGIPVAAFDELPKSALCELCNMAAGSSVSRFEGLGVSLNISPPTLVSGRQMIAMVSQVETLVVRFSADQGPLELHIALEM